jgi:hypothetical protein
MRISLNSSRDFEDHRNTSRCRNSHTVAVGQQELPEGADERVGRNGNHSPAWQAGAYPTGVRGGSQRPGGRSATRAMALNRLLGDNSRESVQGQLDSKGHFGEVRPKSLSPLAKRSSE